ncbi:helix-turn-helix domain-containing protein [Cytobacillus sp. Sa5YUA1]|uniref:Helix-turn-helix domain-containing protein n=1 Tax=Cytobacillus stercorigallinarum TaxID=2762240 RepID=A0ABR8QR13_9BACI|nr:helix-turn-helix domain-containing protein [Cytobacillus stercorigallinarum]MBD7937717.1 helix-turn-helix domain-containing protein [Cytobacillus stercorigallinarum]
MYKILIADRDHNDAEGLKWLIKTVYPTWQIEIRSSTNEVFTIIEKQSPDLLLLEMEMFASGAYKKLKQLVPIFNIKILAMTIEPTFDQAKKAIEIGVSDLLVKPVSPEDVLRSLRMLYRIHRKSLNHAQIAEDDTEERTFLQTDQAHHVKVIGMRTVHPNEIFKLYTYVIGHSWANVRKVFLLPEMILCLVEENDQDLLRKCHTFIRGWAKESNEAIILAEGNSNDKGLLQSQYGKIKQRMELSFYTGLNKLIPWSANEWVSIDPFLTPKEQEFWIDHLRRGDIKAIKTWLYEQFLSLTSPYPDPAIIRIRLTSILAQIRRYMIARHLIDKEKEEKYQALFQTILYSPLIYRVIEEMIKLIARLIDTDMQLDSKSEKLAKQIYHYIEEHFHEKEMSLDMIAAKFNRNTSYISSLLTKYYKQSFREIVTMRRIKKATQQLTETNLPIKMIAKECGYRNQQYFNKVFNQIMKCSPSTFRANTSRTS